MAKPTNLPLNLDPDYGQSIEFLTGLKPNQTFTLVAIKEGVKTEARSFEPTELDEAEAWISELNGNKYNIYFQVNEARDDVHNKKAKKADIMSAGLLHVDIDNLGKDVLNKIVNFEPSPTAILMSGGGYQAFWGPETNSTDLEMIEILNKAIARELGGDNCHNVVSGR